MEEIPLVVYHAPAGLQLAVDNIVILTVHRKQSGSERIAFSALFALKHSVNEVIAMSGRGNCRAPVNDRLAHLAVGPAGVSRLGAGRRFVGNSLCGVDMSAVPGSVICFALIGGDHILCHLIHLGVDLRTFTGERIGRAVNKRYKTAVDLHADVDGPKFLHALELSIGKCRAVRHCSACICITHFEFPCADRKRSENRLTGLCVFTGAGDGDRCDVFVVLNRVRSLKAGSNCHMVKFPLAHVVEVDINRNRLNLFDIRSNDICIPYRAEKDLIQRRIMGYDFDRRLTGVCLNIDLADHRRIVALLVADREFDVVDTVCKNNIGNGNNAVLISAGCLNAVDICLGGGCIQPGIVALFHIIGNLDAKGETVFGNGLSVQHGSVCHASGRICNVTEHGRFAVIDCIGIVNGDIVDIHDISAVVGLVLVVIIIVSRTVTVGNIELHNVSLMQVQSLICAEIYREVVPTGFLILIYKTCRRDNAVAQCVGDQVAAFNVFTVAVQHKRVYGVADPCSNILIGNVDPHTELRGIFKGLFVTCILKRRHHISGFERVAVVDIERHSTVAAVNLAVCCGHGIHLPLGQRVVILNITEVKHTRIAVFKIEYDIRAFAESDIRDRRNCGRIDKCSVNLAFGNAAVACGKIKTAYRADTVVPERKQNVIRFELNFIESVGRGQRQRDGLAERHGHFAAVERQLFGNNSMNGNRTDFFAVIDRGQHNIADRVRDQNAVRICSVCYFVSNIRGDLGSVTGGADARNAYADGSAGGHILGFGIKGNMVENLGGDRSGNNDKTVRNTALRTVGRLVDYLERILTLGFAAVGHGSAAVKMTCPFAAEIEHDLRLLKERKTDRLGLLVAVCGKDHYLIVFGDTDRLAGVFLRIIFVGIGKYDIAVKNEHLIDAERFTDIALVGFILARVTDLDGAVFEDCKICGSFAAGNVVTVHNEHAGRLTCGHVVVRGIDTGYNSTVIIFISCRRFLVKSRDLLGKFGHTVRGVVHILIGGEQFDRIDRHIDRCGEHLYLFAVFIVNSINVLCDTACERGLLVLHKRQLRICKLCLCRPVCRNSKREHAA